MARRFGLVVVYAIGLTLALSISLLGHLPTWVGRDAVRDIANRVFATQFRGRLRIARVDRIDLRGGIHVTGATLDDADGRRIVDGADGQIDTMRGVISSLLGTRGAVMPAMRLHVQRLRLLPDAHGLPSIAGAFEPRAAVPTPARIARPQAPRPPIHIVFPELALTIDRVESELGGVHARADGLRAHANVVTEPVALGVQLALTRLATERAPPLTIQGRFELEAPAWSATPATPPPPLEHVLAIADLIAEGVRCHVEFEQRREQMRASVRGCSVARGVIDRAIGAPVGLDVEIPTLLATRELGEEWSISGLVRAGGQPLEIAGSAGAQNASALLRIAHLDLSRLRPGFPQSDLTGEVRVDRHGTQFALDTSGLIGSLDEVDVPGVVAHATVRDHQLFIDDLRSPIGITATGVVDFRGAQPAAWAAIRLNTQDVGLLPLVRRRVRGALDGEVRADVRPGRFEARFAARARNFRGPGFHVGFADVGGRIRVVDGHSYLNVDVDARGVRTPVAAAMSVRGWVTGDPTARLEGRLRGSTHLATRRRTAVPAVATDTALDAPFTVDVARDHVHITVARGTARLNGAHANISGAVTLPNRGDPQGFAHVRTADGSGADVTFHGTDVRGSVRRLPVEWLTRAAGIPTSIGGTIDGDLDLLAGRLGASTGRLRLRGARLPRIGVVDVDVRASRERAGTRLDAAIWFGSHRTEQDEAARSGVRATIHGEVPARLGDARAWVRNIREADVNSQHVTLDDLSSDVGRLVHMTGTAATSAHFARAQAGQPLAGVIGFDLRHVQPVADIGATLSPLLRRLARRTLGRRPLTEPMRLRGAVCVRIEHDDFRSLPTGIDTAVGRETTDPEIPTPTDCTDEQTHVREMLAHAAGSAGGPWHTALLQGLSEISPAGGFRRFRASPQLRARMAASRFDMGIQVGPIDTRRWPFLPVLALVSRAFARPRIAGTLEASLTATGPMLGPTLALDAVVHTNGHEILVAGSEIDLTLGAILAPEHDGDSLIGPVHFWGDAAAQLMMRTTRSRTNDGNATGRFDVRADLRRVFGSGGVRTVAPDRFEIRTSPLPLGRLRWARDNGIQGSARLAVRETHNDDAPVAASVYLSQLRVRNLQASHAAIQALVARDGTGPWEVRGCLAMVPATPSTPTCDVNDLVDDAPAGGLRAAAALPLRGDWLGVDPDLDGTRIALAGNRFRLESLSPLVEQPPLLRIGGAFTGRAAWNARTPWNFSGDVDLSDGLVEIERLGQPLDQISVELHARDRFVLVPRLSAHLASGTVTGTAKGRLGPTDASSEQIAQLAVSAIATSVPLSQEGNVFGYLTTPVEYSGTFAKTGLLGRIRLFAQQARGQIAQINPHIDVPSLGSRTLQPVEPNSDVFILGESRVSTGPSANPYLVDIDIDTAASVSVERRNMFSLNVETHDTHLHYDGAGLTLRGRIEAAPGQQWFEYLGKRFNLDRIIVQLDGGTRINPSLDIAGHFSNAALGRIDVTVTDRLDTPEIHFRSQRDPNLTESDVLAMLVLGRTQTRNFAEAIAVQEQAANAAIGLIPAVAGLINPIRVRGLDVRPIVDTSRGPLAQGIFGAGVSFADGRVYVETTYRPRESVGQSSGPNNDVQILGEVQINSLIQLRSIFAVPTQTAGGGRFPRVSFDVLVSP